LVTSSLLLLPASKQISQLYAKIFDYLKVSRLILLFPGDEGILSDIIADTNSGFICDTVDDIKALLLQLYHEWQQTGTVTCNSQHIETYSRKNQALMLVDICNELI